MTKTEKTPKKRSFRVLRGGSWNYVPQFARVVNRSSDATGNRYGNLGVRLVEVLDETSNADRET